MMSIVAHQQMLIDLLETKTVYAEELQIKEPLTVYEIIENGAIKYGVNFNVALAVAKCESNLNPKAVGDKGKSRGLWQIHKPSHPKVSDAEAFDPEKSTEYAMPLLKKTPEIWTCYRQLFKT